MAVIEIFSFVGRDQKLYIPIRGRKVLSSIDKSAIDIICPYEKIISDFQRCSVERELQPFYIREINYACE